MAAQKRSTETLFSLVSFGPTFSLLAVHCYKSIGNFLYIQFRSCYCVADSRVSPEYEEAVSAIQQMLTSPTSIEIHERHMCDSQ